MIQKIKGFLFHNSSVRQTVAKNTFWLTVGNVLGRLLRAGIVIYAARILGAEGWGLFSYAIGLIAFLTIFTDLGIRAVLTREVAKSADEERRAALLSTSFFIELALVLLASLVVVFAAPYFITIPAVKEILIITLAVLVFDSFREFGFAVIRAKEKMEQEAGIFIFTNFAIVILGFIFLTVSPSVRSFAASYAIGTGLGTLVTFYVLRDYFKKLLTNFSKKLIRSIITSGWPFAVAGMLGGVLVNIDVLIIGFFRTVEEVGYYSAALRPVQLLYILPTILAISVFPTLSRLAHKDSERTRSMLEKSIAIVFLVAIPLALGGVVLGREIMELLFGAEYLPGTVSFQILTATILVNFPAVILTDAIFAHDKQKFLISFMVLGAVINVVFDLLFIPKFGIVGSAWTTLLAQAVSNFYLWRKMRMVNSFRVVPYLKRVVPTGILMAVFAWALTLVGIPVLVIIGLAAILYFGVLYILKEPLIREVREAFMNRF